MGYVVWTIRHADPLINGSIHLPMAHSDGWFGTDLATRCPTLMGNISENGPIICKVRINLARLFHTKKLQNKIARVVGVVMEKLLASLCRI